MESSLHALPVTRTAHYAMLGKPGPQIKKLWFVTHGYGQLAKTFVNRFSGVTDEETLVIAPEGLSRFYWGGFDGPVVASCMTRENRLDEITDFCNMLDQLYALYVPQCHPETKIILLGFSQGTATQVRWIMRSFPKFDYLMLWAGQLPEDLDYEPCLEYFTDKQLFFAYGDKDPFISPKRKVLMDQILRDSKLSFQPVPYAGVHKVDRKALKAWWNGIDYKRTSSW